MNSCANLKWHVIYRTNWILLEKWENVFWFCFQGGKIRAKLGAELDGAKDVIIEEGTAGEGGKAAAQIGMRK